MDGMKFSIRDLFWLLLLAALCCAWWLDRNRLALQVERLNPNQRVPLDAIVLSVDTTRQLVDVTVGLDDGARRGDILEVHRGKLKIGEISLREINADRSRGTISRQRAPLQKGDLATRSGN
jgi:hypothetical protein